MTSSGDCRSQDCRVYFKGGGAIDSVANMLRSSRATATLDHNLSVAWPVDTSASCDSCRREVFSWQLWIPSPAERPYSSIVQYCCDRIRPQTAAQVKYQRSP